MNVRKIAIALLAVAAALFGMTFVAIKDALAVIPPLSFVGWRFLIGAVVLLAIGRPAGRAVWSDGAVAGTLLFIGYATQTIGLEQTSASNSGLITGLYVVFTPLAAAAFRRAAPSPSTLAGAALSIAGLAALTVTEDFSLGAGDLWTVMCAVAYAFHILALATMAPRHRVVGFTAVQLLVTAVMALILSVGVERATFPPASVLPTLGVTAILVTCGAFLIQVWAQRIVGPSRTAMVLALEPVFAVATAVVVLGERLTPRGWIGATMIVVGTYVVLTLSPPEDADIRTAEALSDAH
jgi:drug/metabolite transporter (DMT)-like permease